MASDDTQLPDEMDPRAGNYAADPTEQARKREAIGLNAHRPTAPTTVQRPPDAGPKAATWWLVFFLVILIASISLIVAARAMDPTTTWFTLWAKAQALMGWQEPATGPTQPDYIVVAPGYELWLTDDFSAPSPHFPNYAEAGVMSVAVTPEQGVYRFDIAIGQMAWSLFDVAPLNAFRIETGVRIDAETPDGAAGLVDRFASPGNFYLFAVDGQGRFAVDLWLGGQKYVIQPPTPSAVIHPAGETNRLTLEDNGTRLRFYVNQVLLAEVAEPQLPPDKAGIVGLSPGTNAASVTFDWVAVYNSVD